MMIKRYRKYKLLRNDWFCYRGAKVYRIQATATNTRLGIDKGELGGYVSDKYVIPQDPYDNSWVADNSIVISSKLSNSKIYGNSIITDSILSDCNISGSSTVFKSRLTSTNVDGNSRIIGSTLDSCTIAHCCAIINSWMIDSTVYSNANIGDVHACNLQIGDGAKITSNNDFANALFLGAFGISRMHVTMYQHYRVGETVLQFSNYNYAVSFDSLKKYFNKVYERKNMLGDKNRENYEKEATEFINSIQDKIEVFKKSLGAMKGNSVVEESEKDKK